MTMKRGRKSAAAMALAPVVAIEPRPVAPSELTDEEAAEWEGIVTRMPATWFGRETWPMLVQLCRHAVAARRLSQLVHQEEDSDEFSPAYYMKLLRALAGQTAVITSISTKLRISPQSAYDKHAAGVAKRNAGDGPKPWK
jgi:hypothetical protein